MDAPLEPTYQAVVITRLIGYHAEEPERAERSNTYDDGDHKRYPLIEWNWGPEECGEALARAGMPAPGKSACFFCPSSKLHEIIDLRRRYPHLLARALEMERRAMAGEGPSPASGIGLGRRFTWRQAIDAHDGQPDLFLSPPEDCSDVCFT